MAHGPAVWTFFYGSFINLEVLKQVGLAPEHVEVGKLSGFDIRIQPLANLVRSERDCVWGVLATATHAELSRLYDYARDGLGGTYLPEAVLAESFGEPPLDDSQHSSRGMRPALCYIAPDLKTAPAASDYIDRIAEPARKFGFPDWYVARIESFRVGGE